MVRPESWIRPAGESPVRVSAGAPGSRPRPAERSAGRAGCREPLRREQARGPQHEVNPAASSESQSGEPSRSCHGEGHVRQSWFRSGCGGSLRGRGSSTRARTGAEHERPVCAASSGKDRSYKPMVKSSGAQRESEGVVVREIACRKRGGREGPCVGHVGGGGKREGMAGTVRSNHPGRSPVDTDEVRTTSTPAMGCGQAVAGAAFPRAV